MCDFVDTSDPAAPQPRRFRNAIVAVAANREGFERAVERKRYELAADEVLKQKRRDKASERSVREQVEQLLPMVQKQARVDAIRAFNRVIFQGRPSVTLEEKYLVSMETPLTTTGGQGKLKDFLDENKYIYAPTAVLDVDLFLDRILPGATPSLDHIGAYPASAVVERALAHPTLRLMQNSDPVRRTALKGVQEGRLLVRLANGDVYDADGMVSGPAGQRRRAENKQLTTLSMTVDVLLAPVAALCAEEWTHVDPEPADQKRLTVEDAAMEKFVAVDELQAAVQQGELDVIRDGGVTYLVRNERYADWPPDGPKPEDERSAHDWDKAIELAGKRRLKRLTLHAASPEAAKTLLALALPFGATTLSASATVGGQVKDGGIVNFVISGVKAMHSLKPLETAATLWRNLAEGAAFDASLTLGFGDEGVSDAAAKLEQAKAGASIDIAAEFGDPL